MTDPDLRALIAHIVKEILNSPDFRNTVKTEVLIRSQGPWPPNAKINQAIGEVVEEYLRK